MPNSARNFLRSNKSVRKWRSLKRSRSISKNKFVNILRREKSHGRRTSTSETWGFRVSRSHFGWDSSWPGCPWWRIDFAVCWESIGIKSLNIWSSKMPAKRMHSEEEREGGEEKAILDEKRPMKMHELQRALLLEVELENANKWRDILNCVPPLLDKVVINKFEWNILFSFEVESLDGQQLSQGKFFPIFWSFFFELSKIPADWQKFLVLVPNFLNSMVPVLMTPETHLLKIELF